MNILINLKALYIGLKEGHYPFLMIVIQLYSLGNLMILFLMHNDDLKRTLCIDDAYILKLLIALISPVTSTIFAIIIPSDKRMIIVMGYLIIKALLILLADKLPVYEEK